MELDEINPIAFVAGIIGVAIGVFIVKRMSGAEYSVGIMWQILTPIVTGLGSFFVVNKMAE